MMKKLLVLLFVWCPLALAETLWIDVRTVDEYKSGHLESAVHMPYDEIEKKMIEAGVDKTTEIKLYCRSGRRSGIALETLRSMGYRNVTNAGAYEQLQQKLPKTNE